MQSIQKEQQESYNMIDGFEVEKERDRRRAARTFLWGESVGGSHADIDKFVGEEDLKD